MEIEVFGAPRRFPVGVNNVHLSHVANIALRADEMVTFTSDGDREYDVTAKEWGYYATPSVGSRLRRFGMRAALMSNIETQQLFVVLVFVDRIASWQEYMKAERQELIVWLDELSEHPPSHASYRSNLPGRGEDLGGSG